MENGNKFTMVARLSTNNGKDDVGYILIDKMYNIKSLSNNECAQLIKKGLVTNMEIREGSISSSNGALKRYTCIDAKNNSLCSTPRAVVLSRVEKDGKLAGYNIFDTNSMVRFVKVDMAVSMCQQDLIVNGKIRATENGQIVSSIKGEYEIAEVNTGSSSDESAVEMRVVMFRSITPDGVNSIKSVTVAMTYSNANKMSKQCMELKKLNEALNSKIKDSIKTGSVSELITDTLPVKACGNTVAGEIPYDTFRKIVKSKNVKLLSNIKKDGTVVACRDLNDEESAIALKEKPEILGRGTEETDKLCKKYASEVLREL